MQRLIPLMAPVLRPTTMRAVSRTPYTSPFAAFSRRFASSSAGAPSSSSSSSSSSSPPPSAPKPSTTDVDGVTMTSNGKLSSDRTDVIEQMVTNAPTPDVSALPKAPTNALLGDIGEPWMTTKVLMDAISFVHENAGLQWWMSIVVAAMTARVVLAPLQFKQIRTAHKMQAIQPKILALQHQSRTALTKEERYELQVKIGRLMQEHGVNPVSMFAVPIFSIPVMLTFYGALRHLVVDQSESMAVGGALWLQDLTITDPYLRLPILNALLMLINVQIGLDGMPANQKPLMLMLFRGLAMLAVPISSMFPSAIHVYWSATSLYSLLFTLSLRIPALRKALNLPPAVPIQIVMPKDEKIPEKPLRFFDTLKQQMAEEMAKQKQLKEKKDSNQTKK